MGQMGHKNEMGHMGHGSIGVTHRPTNPPWETTVFHLTHDRNLWKRNMVGRVITSELSQLEIECLHSCLT